MKKVISVILAVLLAVSCLTGLSGCGSSKKTTLYVYNWGQYISEGDDGSLDVIAAFEEAYPNIRVQYSTYDSNEIMYSKLSNGGITVDVIIPSDYMIGRMVQEGMLEELNFSNIPNYQYIDDSFKNTSYDPENKYSVPYTWGTVGLGINREAVEQRLPGVALDSLDLLFKPEYASKLKDCGISVLDSPQEVIAVVLNYLGKDPYSTAEADREAAKALLAQLQPNLRYVGQSRQIDDLAKGETCLALTYTGDAGMAAARAAEAEQPFEVLYRIPREGTLIWFDTMAIPADAPHPGNARAFIDFMLQPEAIAELTNELFFANANRAATPLLDEAVSGDPDIYPPEAVRARLFAEEVLSLREQRQRTRLWTDFRSQY